MSLDTIEGRPQLLFIHAIKWTALQFHAKQGATFEPDRSATFRPAPGGRMLWSGLL